MGALPAAPCRIHHVTSFAAYGDSHGREAEVGMDEPISFGYWVRRRRKALDLTSDELARQVGCAGVTIRKIEADERRRSRQIAERRAECLQLPPEDRAAFLRAARAELAVDRLAAPPQPALALPVPRRPDEPAPRRQALKGYVLHELIGEGGF